MFFNVVPDKGFVSIVVLIALILLWNYVVRSLYNSQHRALKLMSGPDHGSIFDKYFPIGCCVMACSIVSGYRPTRPPFQDYMIIEGPSYSRRKRRTMGLLAYIDWPPQSGASGAPGRQSEKRAVITLCSTYCTDDIAVSLDTTLIDVPCAQFHRGYYTRATDILNNIPYKNYKRFLLVGHSMGGALASVLGYLIAASIKDADVEIITFGSPKYTTSELGLWMRRRGVRTTHYVNESDPVPDKPLVKDLTRAGNEITFNIDTGNDNVNHGLRVYKQALSLQHNPEASGDRPPAWRHTMGQILVRVLLDLLG